jgi:DNA helicase-2/ATP-dependent DNA helicase PcrA
VKTLEEFLSPEQQAIATLSSEGNLLVVAGPGSGKTRLLTHVAAYQVRRSHPAPWRVLCLTFSTEATKEMRTRIRDPRLKVRTPWRITVANFHGFANQLLGSYGHLQGWPRDAQIFDDTEAREVVGEVIAELGLRGVNAKDGLDAIKSLRLRRVSGLRVPAESLNRLNEAYEKRMAELRVRDYDQLILHSIDLLDQQPRVAEIIRQTYRYIVVDELQDTSGFQLEFVGRLSGEGSTPIFAVADNDQMIYGWRDARAENITEWETRFGAERKHLLGNYRCPPIVVQAANSLIAHNRPLDESAPYSLRTDRQGEIFVAKTSLNDERLEGELVADIVEAELARGIPPDRIAILAPNRFLFDTIEESLKGRDVHCVRVGEDPAAARPFARVLRAALALAVTPTNARARARLTRLLGHAANPADADEPIQSLLVPTTIHELAERVREELGLDDDDPDVVRGRQILTLAQHEWGGEPPSVLGRRIALEWHRLSVQIQRRETAVKMMTTFGAKGLEFRVVILPGFGDQMPYVPRGQTLTAERLEEERRKLYVAITRSEDRVFFVYRSANPSRLLGEIDQQVLTPFRPQRPHS